MSGWTGVDFGAMSTGRVVRFEQKDAQTSALEAFTTADPNRNWTVREIAAHAAIGGRRPVVVGSAAEVAEEMHRLGGGDRGGRLQPRLRRHARNLRRYRRPRGAGTAKPRTLQA